MDRELIEKYSRELLDIYRKSKQKKDAVSAQAPVAMSSDDTGSGGLQVIVTSVRGLYPVKGARVVVFEGPYEQMRVIDRSFTDENGKTAVFRLPAPPRSMSESAGSATLPYANYNISVSADGFLEQVNMNVPVFDGIISLQNADLVLISAAGTDISPRVFDEARNYNL